MNNNYELQKYNCENLGEILGFTDNAGQRWLSAKQIGKWLELTNVRMTLQNIDEDNKKIIKPSDVSGVSIVYAPINNFGETFVNYEGFLEIAIKSRTPRAKQVKKFVAKVFKEVIETGSYIIKPNNQLSTLDILKLATKEIERLELENKQQALQIDYQAQELEEKGLVIEEKNNIIEENNNKFYNNDLSYGIDVGEMASMFVNEHTGRQLGRNELYKILVKLGILRKIEKKQRYIKFYEYRLSANKALNPVFSKNVIPRMDRKNGLLITIQTFLPPAVDIIAETLFYEYGYMLKAGMRTANASHR